MFRGTSPMTGGTTCRRPLPCLQPTATIYRETQNFTVVIAVHDIGEMNYEPHSKVPLWPNTSKNLIVH